MRRARAILAIAALVGAAGCAGGGAGSPPPASASAAAPARPAEAPPGKAPFTAAPAAAHDIRVTVDTRAAKEILLSLARPKWDPTDVNLLEDLTPIRLAIQDSSRDDETFRRDFGAAWNPETKTAVFDFATIRHELDRWQVLLEAVNAGRAELERESARRAASLLPGDRVVSARLTVYVSFGLAGLADHLVVTLPDGTPAMVVDLARVLGDVEPGVAANQVTRLVRLMSGEAFRVAWAAYRDGNPAWGRLPAALGALEPLVRVTAEAGPVALFGIEESFYPLSTWLKEPMQRSVNDLNRMGERLIESEADLETRLSLSSEVKRPDFVRRVAGPAGAYMADGIVQASGVDGLRKTLSRGPLAFFQAYEAAGRQLKELPPFSKAVADRIAAAAAAPRPK